jgi:hypothetical protein
MRGCDVNCFGAGVVGCEYSDVAVRKISVGGRDGLARTSFRSELIREAWNSRSGTFGELVLAFD